jgi:hypothetical protein
MATPAKEKKRSDGRKCEMPEVKHRYTWMGTWNPKNLRKKK